MSKEKFRYKIEVTPPTERVIDAAGYEHLEDISGKVERATALLIGALDAEMKSAGNVPQRAHVRFTIKQGSHGSLFIAERSCSISQVPLAIAHACEEVVEQHKTSGGYRARRPPPLTAQESVVEAFQILKKSGKATKAAVGVIRGEATAMDVVAALPVSKEDMEDFKSQLESPDGDFGEIVQGMVKAFTEDPSTLQGFIGKLGLDGLVSPEGGDDES